MHNSYLNQAIVVICLFFGLVAQSFGQEKIVVISESSFDPYERISIEGNQAWKFKPGHQPNGAAPNLDTHDWENIAPIQLSSGLEEKYTKDEGWFRIKIKKEPHVSNNLIIFLQSMWQNLEIYIDGQLVKKIELNDIHQDQINGFAGYPYEIPLVFDEEEKELVLAIRYSHQPLKFPFSLFEKRRQSQVLNIEIGTQKSSVLVVKDKEFSLNFQYILLSITFQLSVLFWLLYGLNKQEKNLKYIAAVTSLYFLVQIPGVFISQLETINFLTYFALDLFEKLLISGILFSTVFLVAKILSGNFPTPKWPFVIAGILGFIDFAFTRFPPVVLGVFIFFLGSIFYFIWNSRKKIQGAQWAIVGGTTISLVFMIIIFVLVIFLIIPTVSGFPATLAYLIFPISLLVYVAIRFKEILEEVRQKASEVVRITEEKALQTKKQNVILESMVKERTAELSESLENLKSTQAQLIQSEKMASLGELTAGIAHEIQNPLNFVNNFSEVSTELVEEIEEERAKSREARDETLVSEILGDIKQNLEKINHHGKRADAIVKGMLEHSRTSTGEKVPTDINALADEYLRLSYHGLRARDKSFNAVPIAIGIKTDFDPNLPKVNVVPQDIGRVLLNLINNAFQACAGQPSKGSKPLEGFNPLVTVSTKNIGDKIEISVKDNGPGIPESIKDKIFQPFFTTKPTGQGTGLGLSLSYDIVKAHGGEIRVENQIGSGTVFTIHLPLA